MRRVGIKVVLGLIFVYQKFLSPLKKVIFGPNTACRFYPSCSEYGRMAFTQHGFFKGIYLTGRRFLKCHPFHGGGYDPVPNTFRILRSSKEN
ncbi:MAG: membrane protein insertion efficiency factor YidD [Verrucomicrobia bacterium]|nr:MAG: membrane protein insertion efficiency factor YidD [Verrucomicrobiota bacterium]